MVSYQSTGTFDGDPIPVLLTRNREIELIIHDCDENLSDPRSGITPDLGHITPPDRPLMPHTDWPRPVAAISKGTYESS